MQADIIIPLGQKSQYNDIETRFMLRSVAKYGTGVGQVFVIGHKPKWLTNVRHIPCKDVALRKAESIFNKLTVGAQECGPIFLGWSDDTYLTEPMHLPELPVYYHKTLEEVSKQNINSGYLQIVKNTLKVFPQGLFYNVHTPGIYERDKFLQLSTMYSWRKTEILVKSAYYNTFNPYAVTDIPDPKIRDGSIPEGPFFSTRDRIPDGLMKKLHELYPEPSMYEADHKALP